MAVCSYSCQYVVCFGSPAQKSMLGSFQTSKYQLATSSIPYLSTRCWVKAVMRSSHFAQSFGGETLGLYQKECRIFSAASFLGMKLNSTKGFTPLASRPS